RRRHTRFDCDWSSDVCSSDLLAVDGDADQLKILGEQIGVPVYSEFPGNPVNVCLNAVTHAKTTLLDTIILDTAGRLHVAEMPMRSEERRVGKECRSAWAADEE